MGFKYISMTNARTGRASQERHSYDVIEGLLAIRAIWKVGGAFELPAPPFAINFQDSYCCAEHVQRAQQGSFSEFLLCLLIS